MRRICWTGCLLAACALLAACGCAETAAPKETAAPLIPALELPAAEGGEIVPIPVDRDARELSNPPREECYVYGDETGNPTGYADPSISVNIGRGRIYETNYLYARVRIADASQLRTLLPFPLGNQNTTPGHELAKRVQAVIAINGDYPGGDTATRRLKGAVMRQGEMMRLKCDEKSDVLVIDKEGDFHILRDAKNEDVEALAEQAVNIFTFGPVLVENGVPNYDFRESDIAPYKPAQRMAICQTGKLEYLLITSEAKEQKDSVGLTIAQFIDLISSFPEVKTAYNLDGGSSSTVVFRMDGDNWRKINATSSRKVRPLKDIIYFSSAWTPAEPTPEPETPEPAAESGSPAPDAAGTEGTEPTAAP